jgi:hypothetical protein
MGQAFTTEQLVALALKNPPYFAPGGGYHYSNTNYALLAMAIEKLTGELCTTAQNLTRWYGPGQLVSTPADVNTFTSALLSGRPCPAVRCYTWVPASAGHSRGREHLRHPSPALDLGWHRRGTLLSELMGSAPGVGRLAMMTSAVAYPRRIPATGRLDRFVSTLPHTNQHRQGANPHATVMTRLRPHMGATRFTTWHLPGSALPPRWPDVHIRLNPGKSAPGTNLVDERARPDGRRARAAVVSLWCDRR